jgi:hypothetical protein
MSGVAEAINFVVWISRVCACVRACGLSRVCIRFLISYVSTVFGEDFNRTVTKEDIPKFGISVCLHFNLSSSLVLY